MITFIAPTFNEKLDPYLFITSLLLQKDVRWKAIIYSNGINTDCKKIVQHFNDDRITYLESETNNGYWGCYNRIDALMNYVDTKYVCQTSIQDYFTPNAVRQILENLGNDFIYWDSLHNHYDWEILKSEIKISKMDWGNFAIKTEIAKQVGINHPKEFASDGLFIEDCVKSGLLKNIIKINKILTIHN